MNPTDMSANPTPTREASRADATALLIHYGGDVISSGTWDEAFPTAENPRTNLYITIAGVWITIIPRERTNDTFTFGLRIAHPASGVVLLDDTMFDALPVDGDRAQALRNLIADCVSAVAHIEAHIDARAEARANSMEALYLASASAQRASAAQLRVYDAAQREALLKRRVRTYGVLSAFGIDTSVESWRETEFDLSDLWDAGEGALISFNPFSNAIDVIEGVELTSVGYVVAHENHRPTVQQQAALLKLILAARASADAIATSRIAAPLPLPHYIMDYFHDVDRAAVWLNENHALGYRLAHQVVTQGETAYGDEDQFSAPHVIMTLVMTLSG